MRLSSLEVREFRGIRCLNLNFSSDGILVYGPNGVGKSSIIQAIEFLLTGEVSNVTGTGTGRKSPTDDIHHREASPEECEVTATFEADGTAVRVQRCLEDGELTRITKSDGENDEGIPQSIRTLQAATESRLNFLTREDLLRFVDAPDSKRGEALNEMLRLDRIDQYRKTLQRAEGDFESQRGQAEEEMDEARREFYDELETGAEEILGTGAPTVASDTTALEVVNALRAEYDADPLDDLGMVEFTDGITEPSQPSVHPLARTKTVDRLSEVSSIVDEFQNDITEPFEELVNTIKKLDSHPKLRRDIQAQSLIQQGQKLVGDDTDQCPLCLDDWSDRDLAGVLEERRENATEAEHLRDHISERVDDLQSTFRNLERPLESLVEDLEHDVPEDHEPLNSERKLLMEFSERLAETRNELTSGDLLDVPHINTDAAELEATLIPADIRETLDRLQRIAEKVEEPDDQMAAYRTLAVATERFEKYKQAEEALDEKEHLHRVAKTVFTQFQSVRQQLMDDTLSEVYNEFVSLLDTFSSELMVDPEDGTFQSTDAGVEFRVPFHDGEVHRPNLLFSEGQQDIIGLALFLSMTRAVTPKTVDLVLLDDVLSSVDADHRANVARILNSEYGDEFQFLFTTHDLVWSRHLRRSDHIDSEENVVHLSSWSYYAGVHQHIDITQPRENIEYHLRNNDLTAAAAWARKMAEYYAAKGCENFNVEVRFDKIRNLSLSDYLSALMPVLSNLLREGETDSETTLDNSEVEALLSTIGDMQMFIDQNLWGMNKNVHYSEPEVASFTRDELQSNIEDFEKIFEVVHCDDCESWRSETDTGIECDCSILLKS